MLCVQCVQTLHTLISSDPGSFLTLTISGAVVVVFADMIAGSGTAERRDPRWMLAGLRVDFRPLHTAYSRYRVQTQNE